MRHTSPVLGPFTEKIATEWDTDFASEYQLLEVFGPPGFSPWVPTQALWRQPQRTSTW